MLHNQQRPLSRDKAEKIRKILNSAAGHELLKYLADQAAWLTAQAGNKLYEAASEKGAESDRDDALKIAQESYLHRKMVDKLLEFSQPDYVFKICDIQALPIEFTESPNLEI